MFPGLRQGAVDLHPGARASDRRLGGGSLGQCGGVPTRDGSGCRIVKPRGGGVGQTAGAFQRHIVIGQRMLDALERPDRLAELVARLRVLDRAGQRGGRHTHQVRGCGQQRRRQCRFQVDGRDGDRLGVDVDIGDRLGGIGALGVAHGCAVADADHGGDGPVGRRRQRHDQLGAGEPGHRDRAAPDAPVLQRHRNTGQSISGRVHGQCGDSALSDVGHHVRSCGPGGTQQTGGQADARQ